MTYFYFPRILIWPITHMSVPHMNSEEVVLKLQNDSSSLLKWYETNYLKPDPDKWHLLLSDEGDDHTTKIGTEIILNSNREKILGVYFDKLNFNTRLRKLCKKKRVRKYMHLARLSNLRVDESIRPFINYRHL